MTASMPHLTAGLTTRFNRLLILLGTCEKRGALSKLWR
jgi:hypothetical protein